MAASPPGRSGHGLAYPLGLFSRAAGASGPFVIDARIDPSIVCDMYRKLHHGLENVAPHQRLP